MGVSAYDDPEPSPAWRGWRETKPERDERERRRFRVVLKTDSELLDLSSVARAERGPHCLHCGRDHPVDGRHDR